MDRRGFLRAGAVGAAAAAAASCRAPAGGASGASAPATESTGPAPAAAPAARFTLAEWTIDRLQKAMASGELTSRAIVEQYLARIAAVDRSGPTALRSVIEENPDALAIAGALDDERKAKGTRGPLHGIPIVIKDNIDTADRMSTTAGSLALAGSIAAQDAGVAAKLRAAGAVLLGKTNLSEWANFRSTHSSSGWSGRGGQTLNPYATDRSPCGSSSGSGVAASANLCAAAIGTETDGSIICPSSVNGLVGIKPTVGLVSRAGIIPISHTQDTAGPMARTVADAAALLGAIAGADPRDAATAASAGHVETDYTRSLDPAGLKGARLGIARTFFGFHDAVDKVLAGAIDAMKAQGAILVDPIELVNRPEMGEAELLCLLYEFKDGLDRYLAGLAPSVTTRTLAQLVEWNEQHRDGEMPHFGQELFTMAAAKGPLSSREYRAALAKCQRMAGPLGLDAALKAHRLDAIVTPSSGLAWKIDHVNGDPKGSGGGSSMPAIAGYPHITVPAGLAFDLPAGISFIGRPWSEPRLIAIAHSFEQATRARRPPPL